MKTTKIFVLGAISLIALSACKKEQPANTTGEVISNTKSALATSTSGSLSQFTIAGDFLYTVDYKSLHVFSIESITSPVEIKRLDLGVGIETIYRQNNNLFIGTQNGVRIYDISVPENPTEISQFEHVTSCDPVVASENTAIATLRGGTECGGNLNEMDLFDISDIRKPTLISHVDMINPYGLCFSEINPQIIYVCDGISGLKIFDITTPQAPELITSFPELEVLDVISGPSGNLIVLTTDGIIQFDANDPVNLSETSFIPAI